MTFDVLEQERGRLLAADEVSDRCRLEIGIDFRGDALELPKRLDLFEPSVEIAGVGAASNRFDLGFLALTVTLMSMDVSTLFCCRLSEV